MLTLTFNSIQDQQFVGLVRGADLNVNFQFYPRSTWMIWWRMFSTMRWLSILSKINVTMAFSWWQAGEAAFQFYPRSTEAR